MQPSFPIRKFDWSPHRHLVMMFFICLACIVAGGLLFWNWLAVVPWIAIAAFVWHMSFRIRCPACSHRMRARVVLLDHEERRHLFDCQHCQITWDPAYIDHPNP